MPTHLRGGWGPLFRIRGELWIEAEEAAHLSAGGPAPRPGPAPSGHVEQEEVHGVALDCSARYTPTSPDSSSPCGQGLCEGPAATSLSAEKPPETCTGLSVTSKSRDTKLLPQERGYFPKYSQDPP